MHKAVIATLTALTISSPAFAWDKATMNAQIDETNVIVSGICSGTLVGYSEKGEALYLTAKHCTLESYEEVTRKVVDPETGEVTEKTVRVPVEGYVAQRLFDGNTPAGEVQYRARVKATEAVHDLALFETRAPVPRKQPAVLSCEEPGRGDAVYAVGNPGIVFYGAVSMGNVVSTRTTNRDLGITEGEEILPDLTLSGDDALIVHTATIAPGSSGGALYDDKGELIGVNVMSFRGLYMSVPLADVRAFLADNGVKRDCK